MAQGREPIQGPDGVLREWQIEFYETEDGRKPVLDWIKEDLTPTKRRALGTSMRRVLQVRGPEVTKSAWGAPVAPGNLRVPSQDEWERGREPRGRDPRNV